MNSQSTHEIVSWHYEAREDVRGCFLPIIVIRYINGEEVRKELFTKFLSREGAISMLDAHGHALLHAP